MGVYYQLQLCYLQEKIYQQIVKRSKCGSTMSLMCDGSLTKSIDSNQNSKKEVKIMLGEINNVAENLKNLIFKVCIYF